MRECEATGKTIEQAVQNALLELKAAREDCDIKILSEGGFLKKARVLVSISPDALEKYEKKDKIKKMLVEEENDEDFAENFLKKKNESAAAEAKKEQKPAKNAEKNEKNGEKTENFAEEADAKTTNAQNTQNKKSENCDGRRNLFTGKDRKRGKGNFRQRKKKSCFRRRIFAGRFGRAWTFGAD